MIKINLSFLFTITFISVFAQSNIKSPSQYFEHYEKTYTLNHKVEEYLDYLDSNSDQITKINYGKTSEGRPLNLYIISSADNIKNVENIRKTNLFNIGLLENKPRASIEKAIVWMSFGVHGNEAGTTESVMNIIYNLAFEKSLSVDLSLQNTIVIIDPSSNPDGNNRYTQYIQSVSQKNWHPNASDREHMEPWPSGRLNHYLFDLNRDWAWQTQVETQQRIAIYNQWMPHVHADFHEMGYNQNYYFAPAAEPFHQYITDFQREFQTTIGKNHALKFDQNGWLYFTREFFDLFYPSYGDTYPTYNGAIGLTYEQAGHGRSGRAIQLENGDTLSISDKIKHNTVVALSTIETSGKNHIELIKNFKKYFSESTKAPKGKFKSYVLKANPASDRLTLLFDRLGIRYDYSDQNNTSSGYQYSSKTNKSFEIQKGDIVVNTNQPRSVLLQILMEEEPVLSDSLTYDISAWALPFAYDIECYAFTNNLNLKTSKTKPVANIANCEGEQYAYLLPWGDLNSAQKLSALYQKNMNIRVATKSSKHQDRVLKPGDLIITKADNKRVINFDQEIRNIFGDQIICLSTGFSEGGGDLGGHYFQMIHAPKILLLSGDGTDANSVGEVWHLFEQHLEYPISIVEVKNFRRIKLADYNTLILPNGYLSLKESEVNSIESWVSQGGKLILIENAINAILSVQTLKLEPFVTDEDKAIAEKREEEESLRARSYSFESQERRWVGRGTAGAVFKNTVDTSHPLAYGMNEYYFSLKTNNQIYPLQKNMWNVIRVPKNYQKYGFIGHEIKEKFEETLSFGVRNHGSGFVIYMVDNPLFRGFWDKGLFLFSNAVFFLGNPNAGL